jgi:rSAM/selenodomain-associated transferase 1
MNKGQGVLCILSKAPVVGKVKTRLIPALGGTAATALYEQLLIGTLKTACASDISQVRLYCTPSTTHPFLQECARNFDIELFSQKGPELGARMSQALSDSLCDFDYALVLGCDCPWLKVSDLNEAYTKLTEETEVVVGPAEDGGYYLLGLRSRQDHLFENMAWGKSNVLEETRDRLQCARIDWHEINEYPDIDLPEDLPAYNKMLLEFRTK